VQQLCLNLMGRGENPFLLAGESGYDERQVLPAARREGDGVALSVAMNVKQGLHFWAGDYAGAVRVSDEAVEHLGGMAGMAGLQLFYLASALSRIRAAPNDRSTRQSVRQVLALHRNWAASSPANYAAPFALIEGAWARARGQHSKAERLLARAIELAAEHQLPLIGALAHEEAATHSAQTDRPRLAAHMLRSAYQGYLRLIHGCSAATSSRRAQQESTLSARIRSCARCRQRAPQMAWPRS
jgi:hypothetical protein